MSGPTSMPCKFSVVFVLGSPGAGKSTLGTLLTEKSPVQHISVGNVLRRIKNDPTHPQAGVIASLLNEQQLLDAQMLVPILKNELEECVSREPRRKTILVDGFPRNLAQLREFEAAVAEPIFVLCFHCAKDVARKRYLTRNEKGRETDSEALFEMRYAEYVLENADIARTYRDRGLLVEIDTGGGKDEVLKEVYGRLEGDRRWMDAIQD